MPPPKFPFRLSRGNKSSSSTKDRTGDPYYISFSEHFIWKSSSGLDSIKGLDWVESRGVAYLEKAYAVYRDKVLKVGDLPNLPATVVVRASSDCEGGISGGTANGELSYCAGIWGDNQFCYGILTHELCNAFTGECVSGNWPVEWWANHRSPFPTVAANEVMRHIVPEHYQRWGDYGDPLVRMFSFFFRESDSLFPRMLSKMQELRVSLEGLSDPYKSHLIYYFLFYGAEKNVGKYFVSPPMPPINYSLIEKIESKFRLGVSELRTE